MWGSGIKIKCQRSDGGGEYAGELIKVLNMNGIKHERSSPYSTWQNGIAERYNRTVLNLVRAMLDGKYLQKKLWEYAADQAVYVINRVAGGA